MIVTQQMVLYRQTLICPIFWSNISSFIFQATILPFYLITFLPRPMPCLLPFGYFYLKIKPSFVSILRKLLQMFGN